MALAMAGMVAASEPSLHSLAPNGPSGSMLSTIMGSTAVVRRPYLVYGHFAGFFVHAHLGHLRGIGVGGCGTDARSLETAAPSFGRGRVRTGAGERPVEGDSRDHGLLECHPGLERLFFALLLQRIAQDLTFDATGNNLRIDHRGHRSVALKHPVIAENQFRCA